MEQVNQRFTEETMRRIRATGSTLVDGANPLWVTQRVRKETTLEAIEADWAAGKPFRVYQHAIDVTVADTDRALRAGFTHLRVVFQRLDLSVAAVDVELAKHRSV